MKILYWLLPFLLASTCFARAQKEPLKPIVVVVCSYNNINYFHQNLKSILDQEYGNFRVIYVDDCSPDGTGEAVEEFIKSHPNGSKVELIRNKIRKKAMANHWHAIHSCRDEEIIVNVDGDDWLPHNKVLDIVASYYNNPDVWLAYSNFLYQSNKKPGLSRPLPKDLFKKHGIRKHPFVTSHLRTFYAGLFKKIRLKDLVYEGNFVPTTCDPVMMFPMLEMAADHICFMKEKLYIYNDRNPISDQRAHRKLQSQIYQHARTMRPYSPLADHPGIQRLENTLVDVVSFSHNRPMQLHAFLQSLYENTCNSKIVTVIYRADNEKYESGYQIIKDAFPSVRWLKQEGYPDDFKKYAMEAIFNSESISKFVAFATDNVIVMDKVDFSDVSTMMNKTSAFGFCLGIGKNTNCSHMLGKEGPPTSLIEVGANTYAWKFSSGAVGWGNLNNADMTIYRKSDIRPYLTQSTYTNPNTLEKLLVKKSDKSRFGLCYDVPKIMNISINTVCNP